MLRADAIATAGSLTRLILGAVIWPRYRAIITYRTARSLWLSGHKKTALLISAISVRNTIEIHPAAQIGPGLTIVHGHSITIGPEVRAGENLRIHHGVTLGDDPRHPGQPQLGSNVTIGCNATILGPIKVPNFKTIKAHTLLHSNNNNARQD